MDFWYLKKSFQRGIYKIELLNPDFFDDVYIKDKKLKSHIKKWLLTLIYKDIYVPKFLYLFDNFEEFHFPIKIDGWRGNLFITDDYGNEYYFFYSLFIEKYTIGIRKYPFNKNWTYCLTENGDIILEEFDILQITKNYINTDNIVKFYYNHKKQLTRAILKTKTLCLEIVYPTLEYVYDDQLSSYLFDIACQFPYIDDLHPIFEIITNVINDMNVFSENYSLKMKSFYIAEEDNKLLSEVNLTDGIVTKYSYTSKENNSKICLHQTLLSETLKDFILNYKK